MIIAFIGAELAGGQILPPAPLRVILNPIPGRGLRDVFGVFYVQFALQLDFNEVPDI